MLNPLGWQFNNTLEKYGYDVILNGEYHIRVLLKEYMERTSTSDYKYMLFKNGLAKQGDIVTLFGDNWLILHEDVTINNVYTKVIIRRLKFNINFIVNHEVVAIPCAIDEGTYKIKDGQFFSMQGGNIVLFMQENAITSKINKENRFLIMGSPWKIVQKTNTEHGIIKVYADITIYNEFDDKENEIPDTDKIVEPEPTFNIVSVESFNDINVANGTLIGGVALPNTATVTLDDDTTQTLNVAWDVSTYDGNIAGTYNLFGALELTEFITNTDNVKVNINIIVAEVALDDNYTINILGKDRFELMTEETYTAKVLNNGIEVSDKQVVFSLNNTLAIIKSQSDNVCVLKTNTNFKTGKFILTAKLVDDDTVFSNMEIIITGF